MKNKEVILALRAYARRVKTYVECVKMSMTSLSDKIPMEEELKETSRMMYDSNGQIFLYYNGVYYSWEVIISILKEQDMITENSLYDIQIDKQ